MQLPMRFWEKVSKTNQHECWVWTASSTGVGYGGFRLNGKTQKAHRLAWTESNGPIPEGLNVCHRCDNRRCCNPAHMFLGTHADNARDRNMKGRQMKGRGSPLAKLSEEAVRDIRSSPLGHKKLAEKYRVAPSLIISVRQRKAWRHIT